MIDWAAVVANSAGAFPDVLAINSSGAATPDGTEFIAGGINNWQFGVSQALMDWAAGTQGNSALSAAPGVPDGVTEAAGASQILEAIQKGHGIGPGKYVQWGLNEDPSVTGDRVLLLSEQGVLRATYADLNDAVWVPGNDAAQAAAKAAGAKFWSSDDAAGTTGVELGPWLQLPANNPTFRKQYLHGVDFTVTMDLVETVSRAVAVPYQTSDGAWRMIFTIASVVGAGVRTSGTYTIPGVTFKNVALYFQEVAGGTDVAAPYTAMCTPNTGNIFISHVSISTTKYWVSGDLELESKPTWADDFEIPWGITY